VLALLAGALLQLAPVTVAAPGLRSFGVEPKLVDAWLDRTVTVLSATGIKVTSHSDLEQAIGLERQRELLGCADSSSGSCLAELAGALGVDALLVGSVVKSESGYTVTLRMVAAKNGQELAAATGRFRDEAALLDWLDATAPQLAEKVQTAMGRKVGSAGIPAWVRWSGAIVGGAAVIAGVILLGISQGAASQLNTPGQFQSSADIDAVASRGSTFQSSGWVLGGVGLAACVAGLAWGLFGGSHSLQAALTLEPGAAFASLGGTWP
jgi:hypothetical protein